MIPGIHELRVVAFACAVILLTACKGGGESSGPSTTATTASANAGNSAPTITGSANATARTNAAYSFAPAAIDADGDVLSFQIQNKPAWATFNTVNGQLAGSPTDAQVGAYADIVISASDGKQSTSLEPFTIEVKAATGNSVTLAWIGPTENVDGTPLMDLAGFLIAYGTTQTELAHTVHIDSAGIDRYTLSDLEPGTYYFGVKALSASGVESALSPLISAVIE